MNDTKIKQQIADKINKAANILVTVSRDPSVDELSAALGLTLLLNKLEKHPTAIFSGELPSAIDFLEPGKTFENTTDSLRDFIIAIDKEKADHLRYKLEGDFVKIYITPYRTTITSDDLEFSQGDYNVELILALGVENKGHLDAALDGHGKILHDATVVTLTAGEMQSDLGSIDWHDKGASSLSEMLVNLHDALKLEKPLIDQAIATAWLTGIVSATERFSNSRTSSRTMTVAAKLMSAGADQQLIATKLQETTPLATETEQEVGTETPAEDPTALQVERVTPEPLPEEQGADGTLDINHRVEAAAKEVGQERLKEAELAAEQALEVHTADTGEETATPLVEDSAASQPRGAVEYTPPPSATLPRPVSPPVGANDQDEPMLGGTLNATTEQASEDKRKELEKDKNRVILSHTHTGEQTPIYDAAINAATSSAGSAEASIPDIFSESSAGANISLEPDSTPTFEAPSITPPSEAVVPPTPVPSLPQAPAPVVPLPPTLADLDAQNRITTAPHAVPSHEDARAEVAAALAGGPTTPPSLPETSFIAADIPGTLPDIPLPPPPPLPADYTNLPPLPPVPDERLGDIFAPTAPPTSPAPAAPADPGQFRIPGQ